MLIANLKALGQSQEVNLLVGMQAEWMEFRTKGLIKINIISLYEQGYISYSEFVQEFPDSISESQECLFGTRCVEFYVGMTLGKIKH